MVEGVNLKSTVDSSEDDPALNKKGREKKDHGFCDFLDEKRRATYKQHISVYLFLVFSSFRSMALASGRGAYEGPYLLGVQRPSCLLTDTHR